MRFSRILLAVSLSTGLVFAGAATAASTVAPAAEKSSSAKAEGLVKFSGKVESVDAIGNILIVKTVKKTDTVSLTAETKITNMGKDVVLSDLKTGENVRVLCKKEETKLIATDIKVGVAQVKKAAAATTAPATPVEKK